MLELVAPATCRSTKLAAEPDQSAAWRTLPRVTEPPSWMPDGPGPMAYALDCVAPAGWRLVMVQVVALAVWAKGTTERMSSDKARVGFMDDLLRREWRRRGQGAARI